MKKTLLFSGLLIVIVIAGALIYKYNQTKSYSPEATTSFDEGDLRISVYYNRPYKKGREIFGVLVPFGKTWRTGANEPTVFETSKDLLMQGKMLKKGRYSLWTVPNAESWQVVLNSHIPNWGIDVMNNGEAARNPKFDVVVVDVPVMNTQKEFEQFTISIARADDMLEMVLAWDKTLVAVPISVSE